jgi:hypothetical protein
MHLFFNSADLCFLQASKKRISNDIQLLIIILKLLNLNKRDPHHNRCLYASKKSSYEICTGYK